MHDPRSATADPSTPMGAQQVRLLAALTALAREHHTPLNDRVAPSRFIDGRHRAYLCIRTRETRQTFGFHFGITDKSSLDAASITASQRPDGRFACAPTSESRAEKYRGPVPEAADGALDEDGFLALARRCFAFYRGLSRAQPVTPDELHAACAGLLEQRGVPMIGGFGGPWSASPSRRVGPGWTAHFFFIRKDGPDGTDSYAFSIIPDDFRRDSGTQPGFTAKVTSAYDASGRLLLRYEYACKGYDGDRPEIDGDNVSLDEALMNLDACVRFYQELPPGEHE